MDSQRETEQDKQGSAGSGRRGRIQRASKQRQGRELYREESHTLTLTD